MLSIDDFHFPSFILKCNNGTQKVLVAITVKLSIVIIRECKRKDIVPKGLTLLLLPSVRTLVIRDQKIRLFALKEILDCLLVYIQFGHSCAPYIIYI